MAFIDQLKKEDDEQKASGSTPVGGATTGTGGVGAAPVGASKPSGSGRFTNLTSYLKAARGGEQGAGERIAGQIGQTVGKQTAELGKAVESAKGIAPQIEAEKARIAQATGFAQQIEKDPTYLTGTAAKFTPVQPGNPLTPRTAPPPGHVWAQNEAGKIVPIAAGVMNQNSMNVDRTKDIQQLLQGTTTAGQLGKQTQEAVGTAQTQLGGVQALAGMTGSEAGRFDLLRQSMGRPTYSRGQQKLDQLLLQASGSDTLGKLQRTTAEQARAGEQLLGTTKGQLETGLGEVGTQAADAQALLKKSLGGLGTVDDLTTPEVDESKGSGAFGLLQNQLRDKQQGFITAEEKKKTDIQNFLSSGGASGATPEVLAALGLKSGQNLYNVDIGKLVSPEFTKSGVTEQSVAGADDLRRLQALAKLSGSGAEYLTPDMLGKSKGFSLDPTQVGNLQSELAGAEKGFKSIDQNAKDYIGSLYGDTGQPSLIGQYIKRPNTGNPMTDIQELYKQATKIPANMGRDAVINNINRLEKEYAAQYASYQPTRIIK